MGHPLPVLHWLNDPLSHQMAPTYINRKVGNRVEKKKPKQHSVQFKVMVVLEASKGEKAEGEIARAYE